MVSKPDIHLSCLLKEKNGKPLAPITLPLVLGPQMLNSTQKEDAYPDCLFSKPFHETRHLDNSEFAVFMRNVMHKNASLM